MLTVHLTSDLAERLSNELIRAGPREIGGVLMGEQITPGEFTVTEMTFQRQGGRFASFVRSAKNALTALNKFFDNTDHQYCKYNYLGEWHSHPSFSTNPSSTDHKSMTELASQDGIGATFIVLMIVRIKPSREIEGTITVYLPNGSNHEGKLEFS